MKYKPLQPKKTAINFPEQLNRNKITKVKTQQYPIKQNVAIKIQNNTPVIKQSNIAVSKPKFIQSKPKASNKSIVKFIHEETTAESIQKIKRLRNIGVGKVLAIVANGPSVLDVKNIELLNDDRIDVMSINKPYHKLWPTKYWSFYDPSQFRRHQDLWESYNGTIINGTGVKRQKANSLQVKSIGGKGFSFDLLKGLHIGNSTVYASMQFAVWMNYDKVYIFGVDMNVDEDNNKLYFYGQNPDIKSDDRKKRFANEAAHYLYASENLDNDTLNKFVFCSSRNKWPFVNKFHNLNENEAVSHLLSSLKG